MPNFNAIGPAVTEKQQAEHLWHPPGSTRHVPQCSRQNSTTDRPRVDTTTFFYFDEILYTGLSGAVKLILTFPDP